MLCDITTSVCMQCKVLTDCPASSYCSAGMCEPDICDATESMCAGVGVVSCNAAGSGWESSAQCPTGVTCVASAGKASCGGLYPDGGGAYDGGGACTSATVDPCTTISKYIGTQVVDGNGDDFCSIPSFQLDYKTAAATGRAINYHGAAEDRKEVLTGRVAWGPDGLHGYFDVTDPEVQTVNMLDPTQALISPFYGDSIEIHFSSSNTVTGLTTKDTNTMHVVIPANGPAISMKADNKNGTGPVMGVPTELAKAVYAQKATATGYAIEVLLPWPPGGSPTSGSAVRFDLVLNSADKNTGGVTDMRDGQLIYRVVGLADPGAASPCNYGSNDGVVPWCDDRTWCETKLQ
jgi:hypothetical protein